MPNPGTEQTSRRRTPAARIAIGSVLVLAAGLAIAWFDTRPGWDDTGVTVGALVLAAGVGAGAGIPFWLAAALAAGPVVAAEVSRGSAVLMALPFALVGACVGLAVRRAISR